MEVGIIAPIKFLREFCITKVQYALPSLILESREYQDFIIERKEKGDTIILDCKKIGWRREPEDIRSISDSLEIVKPQMIILPSFMFNKARTLKAEEEVIERILIPPECRLIQCLEGASVKDISETLRELEPEEPIAIPSHIQRYISKEMLGTSLPVWIENHIELELPIRKGIILTSLPIRLGLEGRLMSNNKPSPPLLTFEEDHIEYPKVVKQNIKDTLRFYEE